MFSLAASLSVCAAELVLVVATTSSLVVVVVAKAEASPPSVVTVDAFRDGAQTEVLLLSRVFELATGDLRSVLVEVCLYCCCAHSDSARRALRVERRRILLECMQRVLRYVWGMGEEYKVSMIVCDAIYTAPSPIRQA